MWCGRARLETCSSIPNGAAMMRPASARGSEAASVEDAAPPTGERRASCLRVDPLDAREPLWREVNKSPAHCMSASESSFQNKYPRHRQDTLENLDYTKLYKKNAAFRTILIILAFLIYIKMDES